MLNNFYKNWDGFGSSDLSQSGPADPDPAAQQPDPGFDAGATTTPSPAPSSPPPPEMIPSSVNPLANTPSAAAPTDDPNANNPYKSHLDAISTATSDEARAIARNTLMRQLYSDFQAAGHEVKWEGDQLIVDGLAYEVPGGSATPGAPNVSPSAIHGGATGDGGMGPQTPTLPARNTPVPPGYEQSKWNDPNHNSPKYIAGHIIANGGTPQDVASALGAQYLGGDRIRMSDGTVVDVAIDYGPGGRNAPAWFPIDFDANGNEIAPNFGGGGGSARSASAPGGAGFTFPNFGGSLPSVPPYAFSYDSLMQQDGVDQQVESNLMQLLQHPESMDAHTVDVLKAKAKGELADAQQQEEQDIVNFGYQGGIGDSPWTQGQRLNSRFNRDVALSKSDTAIDLQAADSRIADQRAAIDSGLKFAAQKQDRRQFAELAKQRATELGISQQQVIAQFTLGMIDSQMKKYGLDLDAELAREGFRIDWAKLEQGNSQFLMDLGFKYANLNEQSDEFDATH